MVWYCEFIWMWVGRLLWHNSIYYFISKVYLDIPSFHYCCQSALMEFESKSTSCHFASVIFRKSYQKKNFYDWQTTNKMLCVLVEVNFYIFPTYFLCAGGILVTCYLIKFTIIFECNSTPSTKMQLLHMYIHTQICCIKRVANHKNYSYIFPHSVLAASFFHFV
jgi:hypothetical protein